MNWTLAICAFLGALPVCIGYEVRLHKQDRKLREAKLAIQTEKRKNVM